MKAIVYQKYGPPEVLQLRDVEKPAPKDNEILIRIFATPVNFGDLIARNFIKVSPRSFSMPLPLWLPTKILLGLKKPRRKILGSEFAGEVADVGKDVNLFKVGDPVFGYRSMNFGAYAEYICMPQKGMVTHKPANMNFEEAATVPYGALTALNLLRKVNIQSGYNVLINGASGAIGSYAVQIAKFLGAKVTGVCSAPRVEYVKSLGADKVIDYTREDFTRSDTVYDLIFDILGKSSFAKCKYVLNETGTYLLASFKMKQLVQMLWTSIRRGKRVICALSSEQPADLAYIKQLMEEGILKSIVDKRFPLDQTAEAHRYAESGQKQGNIVITMAPRDKT